MNADRLTDSAPQRHAARQAERARTLLLVVLPFAATVVVPSVGCSSGEQDQPSDAPHEEPLADGGHDVSALGDAHVSDTADAGCEAGRPGCTKVELTCEVADWCPVETPIDPRYALTAVWGSSKNDVWAVGSAGTVIHWNGSSWTSVPVNTKHTLFGIWGSSANDIWIVSTPTLLVHGTGLRNGTVAWEEHSPVQTAAWQTVNGKLMRAVWGSSAGDVWIGGEPIRHYEENMIEVNQWRAASKGGQLAWGRTFRTSMSIRGIWGSSESDVWIVGRDTAIPTENGKTFHTTGAPGEGRDDLDWTEVDSQSNAELEAVWGSSAGDVWTVGGRGTIRHYTTGAKQWAIVQSPTLHHLHAVWGTSSKDIWAVGDGGTILHFDGQTWTASTVAFAPGESPNLYGVWGSGPDDVWVVGEGIVLHHSGPKASVRGSR